MQGASYDPAGNQAMVNGNALLYDAENRLRQTEQNLARLRDIVSEIEPRLAPLAEQARRAIES